MIPAIVCVRANVVEDDAGIQCQVPVLMSGSGIIEPLLQYLLYRKREGASQSTIKQIVTATQLLLKYMVANESVFSAPSAMFEVFTSRLFTGTIDDQGYDPSGLYWLPLSRRTANQYIACLTRLTDWLSQSNNHQLFNPIHPADTYTQRLNFATWYRRNQHNFLGHIKDKRIHQVVHQARTIRGKQPLAKQDNAAITFPEKHFEAFFKKGLGGGRDKRAAIRDQLILLLMHGAGLRESEALHLWISDVQIDPALPGTAKVRIYNPEEGLAPFNWRSATGATNRAAYLKACFGLTPRTQLNDTQHLGWKAVICDGHGDYLDVHWFSQTYGLIFSVLWQDYLRLLTVVERHHPYAFITFHPRYQGRPYTLNAFHQNYRQGLKRLGLKACKATGLSPHGHRHCYGQRLRRAKVPPVVIKKCLHHASLNAQAVYTTPTAEEITQCLNAATERLSNPVNGDLTDGQSPTWDELTEHGFEDIDPSGLLTGQGRGLR